MKKSFDLSSKSIFSQKDKRLDVNYWIQQHITYDDYISFDDIFEIVESETPQFNELPDDFDYCEIGHLNSKGELNPVHIFLNEIGNEDNDDLKIYNKIFSKDRSENDKTDDITIVNVDEILIAKTRPLLNKIVHIHNNEYEDNSKYYYTKAFFRIRMKDENVSSVMGYYLLKYVLNDELVSIAKIGKSGYPAINKNDLSLIRIPLKYNKISNKKINEEINEQFLDDLQVMYELKEKRKSIQNSIKAKIKKL